jgi:uncharacterized protein
MHYLVDGYNLLFRVVKKRGSLEKTRRQLIEEINDIVSKLHLQITLVFDGAEEKLPQSARSHFDAIEIVYTSKKQSADEYISEEVLLSRTPSQITVVTNDRELATHCRTHRAKIQTIDEFLSFLMKKKTKKRKLSSRSERVFRESDPELARLLKIFEKKLFEDLD